MKNVKRSFQLLNHSLIRAALLSLVITAAPTLCLSASGDFQKVMIGVGQTEIIELTSPVKRVSIADPIRLHIYVKCVPADPYFGLHFSLASVFSLLR